MVNRLLASPHHGERWGRHWLDVARYADTKDGVLMFGDDRVRPFSYTYRDYVIRAFNEDLGFDRFVQDQLAADVAAPRDQPWRLAAMGLLTVGKGFDNNIHDQIDDRIDVVTRGFLGLTVSCARCHDHKYDAIPTADYYSLYGIFASSVAPLELPLIERPDAHRKPTEFEKQFEAEAARDSPVPRGPVQAPLRDGPSADARLPGAGRHDRTRPARDGDLLPLARPRGPAAADRRPLAPVRPDRSPPDDPIFGPWHDLMSLADADFAAKARPVVARWRTRAAGTRPGQLNPLVAEVLAGADLRSRADVARVYGELIRRVDDEARKAPRRSPRPRRMRHGGRSG